MKSQIKDIVIGIFAVIGFTAIVMGFTVQTQERPKITSIKDQNANDDTQILAFKVEINKLKSQIAETQQVTYATPESHVWEMHSTSTNTTSFAFAINKVTGEVILYEGEKVQPLK